MRRRSRAGGEPLKTRGRKAEVSERRTAPVAGGSSSDNGQEAEIARLTRELIEAREQQAATADVLNVISQSTFDLQVVLQTLVESAARVCAADDAYMYLRDGEIYRIAACISSSRQLKDFLDQHPIAPGRGATAARTALEGRIIHIPDVLADPEYTFLEGQRLGGWRTSLGVPLSRDGVAIGVFVCTRQVVKSFTKRQIELVKNFAAQAVIAIENTRLLKELRESLQQQTATADVLKVISRSTFDLKTVLNTLVESAARLCEADMAQIMRSTEAGYYVAASYGFSSEYVEYHKTLIAPAGRASLTGRVLLEGKPVQIPDVLADPEYRLTEPQRLGGYRTHLGVPLLREGSPIGVILVSRRTVRPFDNKHVELVSTFADQAVIAIENVRLFEAEQQRTRELTESLEQQTATSEVLRVISSSPGELEPVFQAMLANATRICGAEFGMLWLAEGDGFRPVALHGVPPVLAEMRRREKVFYVDPETPLHRLAQTKQLEHIADATREPAYIKGLQPFKEFVDAFGARTFVMVPMLKDAASLGAMAIYRKEVRPFTDKQIELVQNFAAQAVIAIENTRLLNELRQRTSDLTESLEQQTATSKVLEVISHSAFDLQAVFETVAESAVRLCGADRAFIYRFDGELLRLAVAFNTSQALKDFISQNPPRPDRNSGAGRAALERRTVHIPDALADPDYSYAKDVEKIRTVLAVPILKGDDLLGVMAIYRLEGVRPFTDNQIALVETFADQAAIAIDNVLLLDELRHSLQQQTATADVLKVISRSTFDLRAVLQTLVESAARFCAADKAIIIRERGGVFYNAEASGYSREFMDYIKNIPIKAERGTAAGRALAEGRLVHIADVKADPEALYDFWKRHQPAGGVTA